MLNIFNLFLFLFTIWIVLLVLSTKTTWLYLFLGIICAALVSIFSYRLKLIDEKSELLYLSIGFYRHFGSLYFKNLFSAFGLIFLLVFDKNSNMTPIIYVVDMDHKNKFNPALFASTINMTSGLFCLLNKEEKFFIHCLDQKFFNNFDPYKTVKILKEINDDNLV
jgi:multisubunit Na+/H+ antiporter MnhE subunit